MTNSKIAINGGLKTRSTSMPGRYAIGPEERAMIDEVIEHYNADGLDYGYQGVFEERYCRAFTDYMGGGYADSVATGTASLFVAIAALNLPKGAEVIVSPITDPGTLSAIILNNLAPRIADSAERSYNVNIETVSTCINENTKAAVLVHSAGQSIPDIAEIADLLRTRDIFLIEDASQAHGASINGQLVGTFGDIAAFSTMYRKAHVTGACGGTVYTKNIDLYHAMLAHADRGKPRWKDGFDDRDPSHFLFPALNFHTDEMSCAIGLSSLSRLDDVRNKRWQWVQGVQKGMAPIEGVEAYPLTSESSPFFLPIFVDHGYFGIAAEEFAEAVRAEGIPLNTSYKYVVTEWPWVRPHLANSEYNAPNAEQVRNESFNLYLNENYGVQEVDDTAEAIRRVAGFFRARKSRKA